MEDLLAQNAFSDAQEVCELLDREFVESDLTQYREHGIDLHLGALHFVKIYDTIERGEGNHFQGGGNNKFMKNVLQPKLKRYNNLTQGQARAALNIMRQEILGITHRSERSAKKLECFVCHDEFDTWDELNAHKSQEHGRKDTVASIPNPDGSDTEKVIEVTESKLGLDLSGLPDGRYAAPDPSGNNEYIYLMVKRARKTMQRDRRYVYGKITTGNEVVLAGTIEVKIWSSDTKELIGEQKPGDVYRGKYEDQLSLIMMAPEAWALLFGKLIGHCCICGKTLTDDISKTIGMGPECEKKENYFTSKPKYTYIGTDRPDPEKANEQDKRLLEQKGLDNYWQASA